MKIALFTYTDLGYEVCRVLRAMNYQICAVLPTNRDPLWIDEARSFFERQKVETILDDGQGQTQITAWLREKGAELGLSVGYTRKIRNEIVAALPRGCFNLHPGLLPEFRGQHVINWAIISGAVRTGLALHVLTDGIDEGAVLQQTAIEIAASETAATLNAKMLAAAEPLIRSALPEFLAGRLQALEQDQTKVRYWKPRTLADGQIRLDMTCAEADRLIRGLVRPWPGAWLEVRGERWHVFKTETAASASNKTPGVFWDEGWFLNLSDGTLKLSDIEIADQVNLQKVAP